MKNSNMDSNPSMHDAVCAQCGKTCQVPFMPSPDKPVYCTECFQKIRGQQSRPQRRDDRRDRKMYSAVCAKCGRTCQIPFQPTPGKPVYCDQCFGKERPSGTGKGGDQLQQINAKLDKLINALIEAKIIKPAKVEKKPEAKAAKPEVKKEAKAEKAKKAPAKKAATKKK
jgi:CxxC-x17-CxxC domain-containing protein